MIYRLLEVQLNKAGLHLTTHQITETLKNMNVTNIDDVVYKALYTNSKALEANDDGLSDEFGSRVVSEIDPGKKYQTIRNTCNIHGRAKNSPRAFK